MQQPISLMFRVKLITMAMQFVFPRSDGRAYINAHAPSYVEAVFATTLFMEKVLIKTLDTKHK